MPVPQAVQGAYDEALPLVRTLAGVVEPTVRNWCVSHDYFFRGRVKAAESLGEKLEGGRFGSWDEIDDLYACSVVVPTALHVDGTLEFLTAVFELVEQRGRGIAQKPPNVFRFDAPRCVLRLKPQEGLERPAGLEDLLFEVQVLTALDYAWQVATHDPIFKGDRVDWRRDRLAAHLKASVEQADSLIAAFDHAVEAIPVSPYTDTERRDRLVAFCVSGIEAGGIPATLTPQSWVRFADNVLSLIASYCRRDRVDEELDKLIEAAGHDAESGAIPVGGSLFQLFVALVVRLNGVDALKKRVIVDSSELRDIYRIAGVPRPMALWPTP